jgi:DNA-binding MarR family transcriptional regulator
MQASTEQFNPFDHFGFLSNRVGRLLSNRMKTYLEEKGYSFPSSCLGIMAELWECDGKTQKQLGMSLIKAKSSVTKMLVQLENHQLIYKKENSEDKRNKLIFLTGQGKELWEEVIHLNSQLDLQLKEIYSKQEIAIAKNVLGTILKIFTEDIPSKLLRGNKQTI